MKEVNLTLQPQVQLRIITTPPGTSTTTHLPFASTFLLYTQKHQCVLPCMQVAEFFWSRDFITKLRLFSAPRSPMPTIHNTSKQKEKMQQVSPWSNSPPVLPCHSHKGMCERKKRERKKNHLVQLQGWPKIKGVIKGHCPKASCTLPGKGHDYLLLEQLFQVFNLLPIR